MKLTKEQKREVLENLAAVIESDVGTDISRCCGDDDESIGEVQNFMESVAEWLRKHHPSQRDTV